MKHSLPGFHQSIEIRFDRRGIPLIQAGHWDDLWWGLGWAHAQDRRYQMEMQRRLALGRLSEIFSLTTYRADCFMRKIDLLGLAQREWALYRPQERQALTAYCAGVNHQPRRSWMMRLLGMPLTPWTPIDCILWVKMMAFGLAANWEQELLRGQLAAQDPAALEQWGAMTVPAGYPKVDGSYTVTRLENLRQEWETIQASLPEGMLSQGPGSNAWAVAGWRSASGKPLLANDPHLAPKAPDSWYQAELIGPEGHHLIGASMAGFPGIVLGQNQHLAWGATNSYIDVQDLFWEKILLGTDHAGQPLQQRWEEIRVRFFPTRRIRVQATARGPLLDEVSEGYSLSLAWTGATPGEFFRGLFGLNRATDLASARQAFRFWPAPSLCYVLADMRDIGYQTVGLIPRRRPGSGLVPAPAWDPAWAWQGMLSFEQQPGLTNPSQGYVVCANHSLGPELSWDFNCGLRAQRIQELLEQRPTHDANSMRAIQMDVVSLLGRRFATYCQRFSWHPLAATLADWDGSMPPHSTRASLFACAMICLCEKFIEPRWQKLWLGPESRHPLLPKGGHLARVQPWVMQQLEAGNISDGDFLEALQQASRRLHRSLGAPHRWQWGRLHGLRLPWGRWSALGGDSDTPNQAGFLCQKGLPGKTCLIASYRMVAELGDPHRFSSCHFPGQSGLWLSGHYADCVQDWLNGRYRWISQGPAGPGPGNPPPSPQPAHPVDWDA